MSVALKLDSAVARATLRQRVAASLRELLMLVEQLRRKRDAVLERLPR